MVIAFALLAAACSSSDDAATETTAASGSDTTQAASGEVLKVAFVHVGPVADKGWSWAHDQGA
jgi:basic membrane lipoprotein Med (substrate-binding protein (PBP1-ABC) superfamily)